jgi:DNA polymerase III subunit epsilon
MKLRMPWRRQAPVDERRWLVVDVESSGLDATSARLLAIAGVALHFDQGRPRVAMADSFEIVLKQPGQTVDKANILLHGIGVGAQRAGVEPREALERFLAWVGQSPLLAFHSSFDETMITRALRQHGLPVPAQPWLDLAQVAPLAQPEVKARALDEWLQHHGLVCAIRHQAAADALVTAELLLKLWPMLGAGGEPVGFNDLLRRARQRRWLGASIP